MYISYQSVAEGDKFDLIAENSLVVVDEKRGLLKRPRYLLCVYWWVFSCLKVLLNFMKKLECVVCSLSR